MDDPRKATAMTGGIAGALLILIAHGFAFWGIDLTQEVMVALGVLLTALIGWFAHRAQEDAEALHARILARLQDHPPLVTPPPEAPLHPIVDGDHR